MIRGPPFALFFTAPMLVNERIGQSPPLLLTGVGWSTFFVVLCRLIYDIKNSTNRLDHSFLSRFSYRAVCDMISLQYRYKLLMEVPLWQ